jgi:two-component system, cell cycle sensor histidine kinase and response regulator CckA
VTAKHDLPMKRPSTILIVEDDEHLRQLTAAVLEREGFCVFQAGNATEAVEVWQSEPPGIDLLIADIVMPGLSGPEIAREFRKASPHLKIVFTSGNERDLVLETAKLVEDARFIKKPYTLGAIIDVVRSTFSAGTGSDTGERK